MKRNGMIVLGLLILGWFVGCAAGARPPQVKAESLTPIPTLSPPEGNATFIDGMTWCVARPGASQADLQNALDWACGPGGADCSPLQPGGRCYQPDTLLTHASYAFNIFYQQNGNSDIACNFGGTGAIVKRDPSTYHCQPNLVCSIDRSVLVSRRLQWSDRRRVLPRVLGRFRFVQVPGIRDFCCLVGEFGKDAGDRGCIFDRALAERYPRRELS